MKGGADDMEGGKRRSKRSSRKSSKKASKRRSSRKMKGGADDMEGGKAKKSSKKRAVPSWMKKQMELRELIVKKEGITKVPEVAKRIKAVVTKAVGDYKKRGMNYENALIEAIKDYKKNM